MPSELEYYLLIFFRKKRLFGVCGSTAAWQSLLLAYDHVTHTLLGAVATLCNYLAKTPSVKQHAGYAVQQCRVWGMEGTALQAAGDEQSTRHLTSGRDHSGGVAYHEAGLGRLQLQRPIASSFLSVPACQCSERC